MENRNLIKLILALVVVSLSTNIFLIYKLGLLESKSGPTPDFNEILRYARSASSNAEEARDLAEEARDYSEQAASNAEDAMYYSSDAYARAQDAADAAEDAAEFAEEAYENSFGKYCGRCPRN